MAASAPGTSSTLAHFQATRSFFIAQGYLNFSAFQATLLAQYHNHLPHDVAEALRGLQRMSSSVNSSISVCLATHHCLTLKDVEAWILESCNDFRGLSSFDQICLGPLTKHPAVVQCFPKAHTLDARVRELTARDVLAAAAKHLRSWSVGAPSRRTATCSMATAELLHGGLSSLVEELGLQVPLGATSPTQWQRIAAELGIYVRAPDFLATLVNKCANSWREAEDRAEQEARKHGHLAGKQASSRPDASAAAPSEEANGTVPTSVAIDHLLHVARGAIVRGVSDDGASQRVDELTADLRQAWQGQPWLSEWLLPQIAALPLTAQNAKRLIDAHCQSDATSPFILPPSFGSADRRELHEYTSNHWPGWSTASRGSGAQRHLVIQPSPGGGNSPVTAPVRPSRVAAAARDFLDQVNGGKRSDATSGDEREVRPPQKKRRVSQAKHPGGPRPMGIEALGGALLAPLLARLLPQRATSSVSKEEDGGSETAKAHGGGLEMVDGAGAAQPGTEVNETLPVDLMASDVVIDHLRSILQDEASAALPDQPLQRLGEVESRLLQERGVSTFSELKLAQQSFATFLSSHAARIAPLWQVLLGGASSWSAQDEVREADAAAIVRAAIAIDPTADDACLEDALASYFNTAVRTIPDCAMRAVCVARRLHGSPSSDVPVLYVARQRGGFALDQLRRRCAEERHLTERPRVACASVISFVPGSVSRSSSGVRAEDADDSSDRLANPFASARSSLASLGLGAGAFHAQATRALMMAPALSDLHEATHWASVFESELGIARPQAAP